MTGRSQHADRFESLYLAKWARGETSWAAGLAERETIPRFLNVLLGRAALPAGAGVLELGCGAGDLSFHLEALGYRVTAVDVAPTAIRMARDRARQRASRVAFVVGDALDLPAPGHGPFDAVVDSLCLHGMIGDDRTRFLHSVREQLNASGRALLMTMCGVPRSGRLQAGYDPLSRTVSFGGRPELHLGSPGGLLTEVRRAGLLAETAEVVAGDDTSGDQDMLLCVARRAESSGAPSPSAQ